MGTAISDREWRSYVFKMYEPFVRRIVKKLNTLEIFR